MSPGTPKKEDEGKNCFYITCGGQFRTIIDFASLFAVIYCTIIVPYDMCFTPPKGIALVAVDVAIEMFFLCEMVSFFVVVCVSVWLLALAGQRVSMCCGMCSCCLHCNPVTRINLPPPLPCIFPPADVQLCDIIL